MRVAKQYIHGQWFSHASGHHRLSQAINSATGELAARYCDGIAHEADAAVAARAFAHTCWEHFPRSRSGTVWPNSHNYVFAEAETGVFRDSGCGRLHGAKGLIDFCSQNTATSRPKHEPV